MNSLHIYGADLELLLEALTFYASGKTDEGIRATYVQKILRIKNLTGIEYKTIPSKSGQPAKPDPRLETEK
jgi:hypothetical protein